MSSEFKHCNSALAQASMSSTSLHTTTHIGQHPATAHPRSTSHSHNVSPQPSPTSPRSNANSYFAIGSTARGNHPTSPEIPPRAVSRAETFTSSYSHDDDIHPYANPDIISYAREAVPPSPLRSTYAVASNLSRNTSSSTVKSYAFSVKTAITDSLLPGPPQPLLNGRQTPIRGSHFQGKEISSPVPVEINTLRDSDMNALVSRETKLSVAIPSAFSGLTGEHPGSPKIALISLDEARAQRSRSATTLPAGSSSASNVPFPDRPEAGSSGANPFTIPSSRARARSISTGAKAKSALQNIVAGQPALKPERRDSEPSSAVLPRPSDSSEVGRPQLKHKRSGFMRLFNGKEREKEKERDRTPPVPNLSGMYNAQTTTPPVPKLPRATYRIPVPQLTPPLREDTPSGLSSNSSAIRASESDTNSSLTSSGSKRTLPPLSINIKSSTSPSSATADILQTRSKTVARVRHGLQPPLPTQSAPPTMSDFPALSLRPVSAVFSSLFAEHIGEPESENPPDMDAAESMSPSTTPSPLTPGSSLRYIQEKTPVATSDDQSAVVQALQDQIVSAKIAWQRQIWELEGQVRDLKVEVDDLRAAGNDEEHCEVCGRGKRLLVMNGEHQHGDGIESKISVVNRPRARTGGGGSSSRFGSGI
jgi:hypothetical protein